MRCQSCAKLVSREEAARRFWGAHYDRLPAYLRVLRCAADGPDCHADVVFCSDGIAHVFLEENVVFCGKDTRVRCSAVGSDKRCGKCVELSVHFR